MAWARAATSGLGAGADMLSGGMTDEVGRDSRGAGDSEGEVGRGMSTGRVVRRLGT